jgi:hypothetical protein
MAYVRTVTFHDVHGDELVWTLVYIGGTGK